jgi:hypothetical protein
MFNSRRIILVALILLWFIPNAFAAGFAFNTCPMCGEHCQDCWLSDGRNPGLAVTPVNGYASFALIVSPRFENNQNNDEYCFYINPDHPGFSRPIAVRTHPPTGPPA